MTRNTPRRVAIATTALLLGITAATLASQSAADSKQWAKWDQSLQGTDGAKMLATFDGKN